MYIQMYILHKVMHDIGWYDMWGGGVRCVCACKCTCKLCMGEHIVLIHVMYNQMFTTEAHSEMNGVCAIVIAKSNL